MNSEQKDLNPFRNAKTAEEREQVWKALRAVSKPVSKEKALRMLREATEAQKKSR
jgi:Arc/MetJ family transcription regulator